MVDSDFFFDGELTVIIILLMLPLLYPIDISYLFSQLLDFLISFLLSLVTHSSFNVCDLISGSVHIFYSFSSFDILH